MTPEEHSLLERTHKLAEENNEILLRMRRYNRLWNVFRILYWVVIILVSIGAFYVIQPFFDGFTDIFRGGQSGIQSDLDKAQSTAGILKDLLK